MDVRWYSRRTAAIVRTTGTIRDRYDYDPYGRVTKVSGDLNAS